MNIITKQISEIKPYEKNPRKNDDAVKYVANSIKEFGFKVPIVIDKDNVIITGHTRYKASKQLGLKEVPCILADDLTDEQIKAYRIADNKVAEFSEWDFGLLDEELANIDVFDMSDFGFDEIIAEMEEKEIEEDEFEIELKEPVSKLGDIYKLGEHILMVGDSTKESDVDTLMNGQVADMVMTDPPYNVAYTGKSKSELTIKNDSMNDNDFKLFLKNSFYNLEKNLKKGGAFYVWYASREHINFETALNENDLIVREQLIWNKNTFTLGRQDYHWKHEPCLYGWKDGASHYFVNDRTQSTVIDAEKPKANDIHPTMKPLKLIGKLIENSSRENETVLDLFGGSGSTLICCEQLGRKCRMMEYDPQYADAIINRWEEYTGKKAEKIK